MRQQEQLEKQRQQQLQAFPPASHSHSHAHSSTLHPSASPLHTPQQRSHRNNSDEMSQSPPTRPLLSGFRFHGPSRSDSNHSISSSSSSSSSSSGHAMMQSSPTSHAVAAPSSPVPSSLPAAAAAVTASHLQQHHYSASPSNRLPMSPLSRFRDHSAHSRSPRSMAAGAAHPSSSASSFSSAAASGAVPGHVPWWHQSSSPHLQPPPPTRDSYSSSSSRPAEQGSWASAPLPPVSVVDSSSASAHTGTVFALRRPFATTPWGSQRHPQQPPSLGSGPRDGMERRSLGTEARLDHSR